MSVEKAKKKTRLRPLWLGAFLIVGVALTFAFIVVKGNVHFADLAAKNFAAPLRCAVGRLTEKLPFSVMEAFWIAAVLLALVFIVRSIILPFRRKNPAITVLKRVLIAGGVALWCFGIYGLMWGVGYYTTPFDEAYGFENDGVSSEQLAAVTEFFLERTLELDDLVPRDENGRWAVSDADIFAVADTVYDNIYDEFPTLDIETTAPKEIYFSRIVSRLGFTGFYFWLAGETNINVDSPGPFRPATVAHELAHQKGITGEQECNFLGIVAAASCDSVVYNYSASLKALLNLMNALYSADKDAWSELRARFEGPMLIDWQENNEYWNSMESKVEKVSKKVYDGYLKSNGVEEGVRSYGMCVDLLVEYYMPKILAAEY